MTTPHAVQALHDESSAQPGAGTEPRARIRFRQPVSDADFIDAAWWPFTSDLTRELPALMDVMWTAGREVSRVAYNTHAWDAAPRRLQIEGRVVRLGGFTVGDRSTITLFDAGRGDRIDILVIPPETEHVVAQRIFDIASTSDDPYRAGEILDRGRREPAAS